MLKTTRTSVTVTGMALPARMKNGTPDQRQLSISQLHRAERLRLRVRRDTGNVAVARVLAADVVRGVGLGHRDEDVALAVVDDVHAASGGRLDRDEAEHLQDVVLDDVAHRADRVVEVAAVGDVEVLRHRDLARRR